MKEKSFLMMRNKSKQRKRYVWQSQEYDPTCTTKFIAVLFTIAKKWKPPKCPSIDEWIKRIQWNITSP